MRILTRSVIATIALLLLVASIGTGAQQPQKLPRVGYLVEGESGAPDPSGARLEDGMREHGYAPGTNVVLERRYAGGRQERLAAVAADLVRLKVEVIVAPSERAAVAAKQATSEIPIVMVLGIDPVRQGLINALARPGGNVTGLTVDAGPDIIAKRLQLLRELAPSARTIALLTERAPGTQRFRPIEEAAGPLGVSVVAFEVRRSEDLANVFAAIGQARAGALLVSGASGLYFLRREIAALALKHRLPAIYPLGVYAEAGGLVSYGVDMLDLFRRAGGYVGRILNGAKAADLPVEQPTKFELIVNINTAKALNLTIPQSLLVRADRLIE